MLQKHLYIKNVKEIIREKLRDLRLKPEESLEGFIEKNKRFYSTSCQKGDKKLFFKILIVKGVAPRESILREIKVRKFLEEFKRKIIFPNLIAYDSRHFPYWFVSQYLEGKLLGHFYELYLKDERHASQLARALMALQKIPQQKLKTLSKERGSYFWQRTFLNYQEMIEEYRQGIEKNIRKKINFEKIREIFKKGRTYFKDYPLVLAHGDFTLANFVVSPKIQEKIIITDWEQSHLDNFAYDISHLWIQLWQYPHWRKKLLLDFMTELPKEKRESFVHLFRMMIITEALGELRWSIYLCEKKDRAGAKRAALKTIEAALKSFDDLANL